MASEPVFTKSADDHLYFYTAAGLPAGGYAIAYLRGEHHRPPPPKSLSFAKAWNESDGLYLFLKVMPANPKAFVTDMRQYVQNSGFDNLRFLWLDNSAGISSQWLSQRLQVNPQGVVESLSQVSLNNYVLTIGAGCVMAPLAKPETGGYGFSITMPPSSGIYLSAGNSGSGVSAQDTGVLLSFQGKTAGCLLTHLQLKKLGIYPKGIRIGLSYLVLLVFCFPINTNWSFHHKIERPQHPNKKQHLDPVQSQKFLQLLIKNLKPFFLLSLFHFQVLVQNLPHLQRL